MPLFTKVYGVTGDPEEFAALASRCPVFRIERAGADDRGVQDDIHASERRHSGHAGE